MQHRASERGNTILISTILILGLTVMGLGVSKFVRSYALNAADRKGAGYPALQALYMAEIGVNNFMYQLNKPPYPVPATAPTAGPMTSGPLDPAITYSPTFGITTNLSYVVESTGPAVGGVYPYRSVGTVTPVGGATSWGAVQRTVRFGVRHNGNHWILQDYAND